MKETAQTTIDELASLVGALPDHAPTERQIDMSAIFGKPAGETLFTYRELTAKEVFQIPALSEKIATQKEDWSDVHRQTIASMILSHVSPEIDKNLCWLRYLQLAEKMPLADFLWWVQSFNELFPELMQQSKAVSVEKKTEGQ